MSPFEPTGNEYVDSCLLHGLTEGDDRRDPLAYATVRLGPDDIVVSVKKVLGLGGLNPEVIDKVLEVKAQVPDNHEPYYFLAHAYIKADYLSKARTLLNEGLRMCKKKHTLCQMYAELELRSGNMPEAVKWWIRGGSLQIVTGVLDDFEPFMNLAYIAHHFGNRDLSSYLFELSDSIRGVRLDAEAQDTLIFRIGKCLPENQDRMRAATKRLSLYIEYLEERRTKF